MFNATPIVRKTQDEFAKMITEILEEIDYVWPFQRVHSMSLRTYYDTLSINIVGEKPTAVSIACEVDIEITISPIRNTMDPQTLLDIVTKRQATMRNPFCFVFGGGAARIVQFIIEKTYHKTDKDF